MHTTLHECLSYSACDKVSAPNNSSSTMFKSILPIEKLNILNVGLVVQNARNQGTVKEGLDSTVLHFSIALTKYSYNFSSENKTVHFFVSLVILPGLGGLSGPGSYQQCAIIIPYSVLLCDVLVSPHFESMFKL